MKRQWIGHHGDIGLFRVGEKGLLDCRCHKVDEDGNVFSRLKQVSTKGKQGIQTTVSKEWRMLKPVKKYSGYLSVTIHNRQLRVNRLVAELFIPNINDGPEVHHINGDRDDNRVENLRWGNQKQNAADRELHGNTARGSKNKNSKLTEAQVLEIKHKLLSGNSLLSLAQEYSVSKKLILLIKQERIWKHIPAFKDLKRVATTKSFVAAHGESGHKHVITSKQEFEVYEFTTKERGELIRHLAYVLTAPAEISHEEHVTKTIEPGIIFQDQELEESPQDGLIKRVVD